MQSPLDDVGQMKTVLETALLTSQDPLPVGELCKLFEGEISADTVRRLLDDLRIDWEGKGVELVSVSSG